MTALSQRQQFLVKLAAFLVEDQGGKSVLLEMERTRTDKDHRPKVMEEWVALRSIAGIEGYATFEEAKHLLNSLLTPESDSDKDGDPTVTNDHHDAMEN